MLLTSLLPVSAHDIMTARFLAAQRLQCAGYALPNLAFSPKPRNAKRANLSCHAYVPATIPSARWVLLSTSSVMATILLGASAPFALCDEPVSAPEVLEVAAEGAPNAEDLALVEAPAVVEDATVSEDQTTELVAEFQNTMEVVEKEAQKVAAEPAPDVVDVKVGRASVQAVNIAKKISQQALEVSGSASALASMSLPAEEQSLLQQISEATKLVSLIASDIAGKEQARLGQLVFEEASAAASK